MHDPEYKVQIFETPAQWQSGLNCGLSLHGSELSLFARPGFDTWLTPPGWQGEIADVVLDDCNQLLWIGKDSASVWNIYRFDRSQSRTERIVALGRDGDIIPRKLWRSADRLWLYDVAGGRLIALARKNLQILHDLRVSLEPHDLTFDGVKFFYTLEQRSGKWNVCRYDTPPALALPFCRGLTAGRKPARFAVNQDGAIFIYDTALCRLLRFNLVDGSEQILGSREIEALKQFDAKLLEIDPRGVLFLFGFSKAQSKGTLPEVHQFDPAGTYLGKLALPEEIRKVLGIGWSSSDEVFLATDRGIAVYRLSIAAVGDSGRFYTGTLDNGLLGGEWHRLELRGTLPPRTSVEVRHYVSDDDAVKTAADKAFHSGLPSHEICERLERLLGTLWSPAEVFRSVEVSPNTQEQMSYDMLFTPKKGRYVWVRLALATFDEKNRPSVHSMRVSYPRSSYLRHLPAAYRENPVHAAFLERFLSLFETVLFGLDSEIDTLFRYFDPRSAPPEFLSWLGSWLNLFVEEQLPVEQRRRLIARAPSLFRRKGTPAGLTELLELYSGKRVLIVEEGQRLEPLLLGGETRVGYGSILLSRGFRGVRVGDTSVVGISALRDRVGDPEEAFISVAGRFSVFVDMPAAEFESRRMTLERILREQKPANTEFSLRMMTATSSAGAAVLGAGAVVTDFQPFRVGITRMGEGMAAQLPVELRVEAGAGVGSQAGIV